MMANEDINLSEQESNLVLQNSSRNVADLALQLKPQDGVRTDVVLRQIEGIQRMKSKSETWSTTPGIIYPKHISLEQASSEYTGQYKARICRGGKRLVDLTGGMGIDFSFMSPIFEKSVYVEQNEELTKLAKHNFQSLGLKNFEVVHGDAEEYISNMTEHVDCIMIDPARRSESGRKTVLLGDCTPDIRRMHDIMIEKSDMVIVKLSPMFDISEALEQLPSICEIHVLSVAGECKELLLVLNRDGLNLPRNLIKVKAVNIDKDSNIQMFIFTPTDERNSLCKYSITPKTYLYEPNASILKSGAFRTVAQRFSISKLHANTHLYTSDDLIEDFPGKVYEVTSWSTFAPYDLHILLRNVKKANIKTRNFPMSVERLRAKLKIGDGGDIYIFATTLSDGKKVILRCKKVY